MRAGRDQTTRQPPHIFCMLLACLLTARRLTIPRAPPVAASLVGTRWTLSLDVGPEKGTWMPPSWGRSGARAMPRVRVEFADGGAIKLLETGPYDRRTVEWDDVGGWSLQGETVRFWLPHKGLQRDDVVLEPGKIWFNAPAWGPQLSRRGNLTIKRSRLGWLPLYAKHGPLTGPVGLKRLIG